MAEISVIVPVYKVEVYLHRCVDSILAQTFTDFELILVDDGSPDNCGKICDEYAEKDNRITVIHQENQGQAAARNHALDITQGDYIAFVDSDDFIHRQMLEILYNNAIKNNAKVSVGGYRNISTHQTENDKKEILPNESIPYVGKEFLRYCLLNGVDKKPWVLWDKIIHRSCFEKIRMPEGRIYEDNSVVYKILYEADIVAECNIPLYFYFQNNEGTTNRKFSLKHLDELLVPQEMIEYFTEKKDDVLLNKANRMYLNYLVNAYQNVHRFLNEPKVERKLRKELLIQYKKEKKRYKIDIKTYPAVIEILYPMYANVYWTIKGVLNGLKRSK